MFYLRQNSVLQKPREIQHAQEVSVDTCEGQRDVRVEDTLIREETVDYIINGM